MREGKLIWPISTFQAATRIVAIDAAMTLVIFLLVVQIWLLSATLETFLAGHVGAVLPAAIFLRTPLLGMPGSGPLCDASRSRVVQTLTNLK